VKLTLSPNRQRWIAIGLAALAAAVIALFIVMPLWSSSALGNERVAMLRRQAQTLEGLVAVAPRYEAIARKLSANVDARTLVIVSAQPGLGVAELQSKLTAILNRPGIAVTASQALPEQEADGLVKIRVQATLLVEIGPLVEALHDIATTRPLLHVEKLSLQEPDAAFIGSAPEPNVPNKLQAEIVVSAHMRQP
jgi:hypothetical protein